MPASIQVPVEMVETVAALRLPPKADRDLQNLMDRNNEGPLTPPEREELEALVELSETVALVRAQRRICWGAFHNGAVVHRSG